MTEIAAYKEWLTTAPTDRGVIETVEIYHPTWASRLRLTNWQTDVVATVADGDAPGTHTFKAARYLYDYATVSDGTEQATTIVISALDGVVYSELSKMTLEDRATGPILVTPRLYWTDDQSAQLVNPPPVWELTNVAVSLDAVRGDLAAPPMRVQRVGIYYDALQFPVLRFAR